MRSYLPQHALELVSPISPLLRFNRIDDCLSPCQQACPAGIDIPKFIRFIKKNQYKGALLTVKEHMPIPLVTGRVCPRPCEGYCIRNQIDEPVAIIGGGPAGLSCGYFLKRLAIVLPYLRPCPN